MDEGTFEPTMHLRWAKVVIHTPTTYLDGPGTPERVRQLQQAWVNQNGIVEWRAIPEVE